MVGLRGEPSVYGKILYTSRRLTRALDLGVWRTLSESAHFQRAAADDDDSSFQDRCERTWPGER